MSLRDRCRSLSYFVARNGDRDEVGSLGHAKAEGKYQDGHRDRKVRISEGSLDFLETRGISGAQNMARHTTDNKCYLRAVREDIRTLWVKNDPELKKTILDIRALEKKLGISRDDNCPDAKRRAA
jgi:hypothetical protein